MTRRELLLAAVAAPIAVALPAPVVVAPATPLLFRADAVARAMDPLTGISMRFVRQYDIMRDTQPPHRFDLWVPPMNATEQRTHRTVTQDLDARLRVVETLLEQVTRNCDILYRQMVAFRAQVEQLSIKPPESV